jgi:hypothetical protein
MRYLYSGLSTSVQVPTEDGGVKDVMLCTNSVVELPSDFPWVVRHVALGYLNELIAAEPQQTAKSKSKESA